jgi:hypothetical protein
MIRLVLITLLATVAFDAYASPDTCLISGTAYDYSGRPMPNAVVRLIDQQTHQTAYRASDANATFAFADQLPDSSGQRYRLDVLSQPTVVVGSLIPTRSVLGISPAFACEAGQSVHADVRVAVL